MLLVEYDLRDTDFRSKSAMTLKGIALNIVLLATKRKCLFAAPLIDSVVTP
jgi:hypothetical protein